MNIYTAAAAPGIACDYAAGHFKSGALLSYCYAAAAIGGIHRTPIIADCAAGHCKMSALYKHTTALNGVVIANSSTFEYESTASANIHAATIISRINKVAIAAGDLALIADDGIRPKAVLDRKSVV